jgi:hypothetical protein
MARPGHQGLRLKGRKGLATKNTKNTKNTKKPFVISVISVAKREIFVAFVAQDPEFTEGPALRPGRLPRTAKARPASRAYWLRGGARCAR